jgi:hypothetical protein
MVDVLCAVTPSASVDGPPGTNVKNTFLARVKLSAFGFCKRDSFPYIFSNLLVSAEGNGREAPFAIDAGFLDAKPFRQYLIHIRSSIPI